MAILPHCGVRNGRQLRQGGHEHLPNEQDLEMSMRMSDHMCSTEHALSKIERFRHVTDSACLHMAPVRAMEAAHRLLRHVAHELLVKHHEPAILGVLASAISKLCILSNVGGILCNVCCVNSVDTELQR